MMSAKMYPGRCLILIAMLWTGCKASTSSITDNRSAAAGGSSSAGPGAAAASGSTGAAASSSTGASAAGATPGSLPPGSTASAGGTASGGNTMSLTVNGANCGPAQYQYPNEPCAAVTICQPGTSNCQTINNLLLDTGSSGLRIFSSLVTIATVPVTTSTGAALAECVSYSGNSSDWGSVAYVDLKLGGEPTVRVPIQLIDSTYGKAPAQCSAPQTKPDTSPQEAGINGVLGVGLANQDCGDYCTTAATNGEYYACSATGCSGTATSVQVQNPVALLPVDNNGVIIDLPSVPATGAPSANGTVIFGIGTAANNTPSGVTTFTTSSSLIFSTAYNGTTMSSFIDSGSPLIVAPKVTALPDCTSSQSPGLFCPPSTVTITATNIGANNASAPVNFVVANADTLSASGNLVFQTMVQDLTAGGSLGDFDWGLPFFLGRKIYNGIDGKTSPLGTGPYWAY